HTLSITRKSHLQGNNRGLESVRVTPLNVVAEGTRMVAQMIEFPVGGSSGTADNRRAANSLVYVLEGKLQLDVGGLHELLDVGDCAYMESEMALAWSAAGKHRCRILVVTPASGLRAED
ncbi:MAG: cupin domain-containing protein, partial [Terracidiphilus sp.]